VALSWAMRELDEYGGGACPGAPAVAVGAAAVADTVREGRSVSVDDRGSVRERLGIGETEGTDAAAHGQPNRSVRIAAGFHPMSISRLLTDSTKPVGPQT